MEETIVTQPSTIISEQKSTHRVECFMLVELKKHPDADTLSVIKIADTDYSYVAKTAEWTDKVGQLVCWVPPDSIVNLERPEFSFLKESKNKHPERIRARKIRGIVSEGLLVLAPKDSALKPGDDSASTLDVVHYDPEVQKTTNGQKNYVMNSEVASGPSGGTYPKYDVDAFKKYGRKIFVDGEMVYLSEKLHGCSAKYLYKDGQFYCGSRTEWKKEWTAPPTITLEELIQKIGDAEKAKLIYEKAVNNFKPKKNLWWDVLDKTPTLKKFLEDHQGWAVYGEIFGQIQKGFSYGVKPGNNEFRAFDILKPTETGQRWMDAQDFINTCNETGLPRVPEVAIMSFNFEKIVELAEGNTLMPGASHIREGIVVKPIAERYDERLGRVSLKVVSIAYQEKN